MTPKFSCADFTFPLLTHDKVLKLLRLLDFEAVDLGIFEGRSHHYPSTIHQDPVGAANMLQSHLDASQLDVSDVFLQTGPDPDVASANDPDPDVRERNRALFDSMLTFTDRLGCRHLTGLPGMAHPGTKDAENWERAVEEARWRMERAESAGITYGIEAHVGSILPDPDTTMRFLQEVPGLTLTLDYGHFIYQGMTNESTHPLLKHASHFHARGGANGMLQSTMKDNTIDYKTIMKGLDEAGYTGYLCMEYVYIDWEGCNRTDNVSETLLLREQLARISHQKRQK